MPIIVSSVVVTIHVPVCLMITMNVLGAIRCIRSCALLCTSYFIKSSSLSLSLSLTIRLYCGGFWISKHTVTVEEDSVVCTH